MIFLLVFLTTVGVLEMLRRRAAPLGLIAYPGGHRMHTDPTPLVGGLGVYAGLVVGVCLLPVSSETRLTVVAAGLVLVATGIWDDLKEAPFSIRFVAQAAAVSLLALVGDVSLRDLGYIFDTQHSLTLGRWGVALTIFAAVGVINAVNMSDGLDGLAGGLALVASLFLLAAAYLSGNLLYAPLLEIVIAALMGFLLFNARLFGLGPARVYLGNSGSLLLGFMLAWLLIAMTQGQTRVIAPVTALWIFALPLCDAVAALLRRPMQGRSPFQADRRHYHHYLRALGLSVNRTLAISLSIAASLALIGILADRHGVPESLMFYGFLGLFALYFAGLAYLDFDVNSRRLIDQRTAQRTTAQRGPRGTQESATPPRSTR